MKIEQRIEALEAKLRPAPRPTFAIVYRDDQGVETDHRGRPFHLPDDAAGQPFVIAVIPLNGRE